MTGASGGVGSALVQLGKLAGAEITAVAKGEHEAWLKALGARSVIPDIGVAGGRFDYVLESVGGTSLEQAIAHVRPNGRIICFGNSSGIKSTFDMFSFFGAENACVDTFFSYRAFDHERIGEDLSYLLDLTSRDRLIVRTTRFGWREMESAISKLEQRGTPGKVVLELDQLK